jgi:acetolactate decarboxylase
MNPKDNVIFQHSTINALVAGIYDGDLTLRELKQYGNMGLGTFHHLDGEMVLLDGEFYKVKSADVPTVIHVSLDEKIPFAAITHFNPNIPGIRSPGISLNFKELKDYINGILKPRNFFYSLKIEGTFKYVRVRSVPYQEGPIYPRLTKVVAHQSEYKFENIKGSLVGFWFPFYMKDINVPGHHFHFLAKDKTRGGHLFDCLTGRLEISAARILRFQMILPDSEKFQETDLNVSEEELDFIEKGKREKNQIRR